MWKSTTNHSRLYQDYNSVLHTSTSLYMVYLLPTYIQEILTLSSLISKTTKSNVLGERLSSCNQG